ncbi:CopG family ribbon-helix-helix protein [Maricaulis sp.]|uniref:CopG family ribbon-helix-helix protein n=1 Tax=Maricaulis sp. TaxID=1486257 RepID=UPI003A9547FE
MPEKPTRVVTAHLPEDLAKRLDEYAQRQERSKGWIVKQALTDWISQEDEWDRMTREGLAAADAGQLVDHVRVEAWAKSLGTDAPLPLPKP